MKLQHRQSSGSKMEKSNERVLVPNRECDVRISFESEIYMYVVSGRLSVFKTRSHESKVNCGFYSDQPMKYASPSSPIFSSPLLLLSLRSTYVSVSSFFVPTPEDNFAGQLANDSARLVSFYMRWVRPRGRSFASLNHQSKT